MENQSNAIVKSNNEFQEFITNELLKTQGLLRDISLTLEQSQGELSRLTQKKAAVTAQLQRFQSNLDGVSKQDIRDTFTEAMDAQQRLLVMRGQLEKLQEQQANLGNFVNHLEKVQEFLETHSVMDKRGSAQPGGNVSLEMLITAQEAERQRLSRQMHDGPAQSLSNFIVQAEITTKLFELDPSKAKEEIEKLKSSAMNTFQKVRTFVTELRPMMLDDLGLIPTIKRHVANLKEQTSVDISLVINGGEKKLEPYIEVYLFRSVQELIGNSIKHNQELSGKLKIDVSLTLENNQSTLIIQDNGKGFNPEELADTGGLGLKLIKDRAEMLGGSLTVNSDANSGTQVTLIIPVTEAQNLEVFSL